MLTQRMFVSFTLVVLLAGCGGEPLWMIPGGKLAGEVSEPPPQWNVPDVIQVETRPGDPYSINIWAVGIGSDLYIATSGDGTNWSGYLSDEPNVHVRVGDKLHALTAVTVTDPDERARVSAAYVSKYEVDAGDNWVAKGLIVRFDPR